MMSAIAIALTSLLLLLLVILIAPIAPISLIAPIARIVLMGSRCDRRPVSSLPHSLPLLWLCLTH